MIALHSLHSLRTVFFCENGCFFSIFCFQFSKNTFKQRCSSFIFPRLLRFLVWDLLNSFIRQRLCQLLGPQMQGVESLRGFSWNIYRKWNESLILMNEMFICSMIFSFWNDFWHFKMKSNTWRVLILGTRTVDWVLISQQAALTTERS